MSTVQLGFDYIRKCNCRSQQIELSISDLIRPKSVIVHLEFLYVRNIGSKLAVLGAPFVARWMEQASTKRRGRPAASGIGLAPGKKARAQAKPLARRDDAHDDDAHDDDDAPKPKSKRAAPKQVRAKGKASKTGPLTCGRCTAVYVKGEVEWVMVAGRGGGLVAAGSACLRCWRPFVACWQKLDWSWVQICGKCAEDSEFESQYETTCSIAEGALHHGYDPQKVDETNDVGVEVSMKFGLFTESQLPVQGLSAKQLGEQVVALPSPFGKGKVRGVLVKHPTEPWVEVKVFHRSNIALGTSHMQHGQHLLEEQGQVIADAQRGAWKKSLPTCLRGNVQVPSMDDLQKRADGMLKGGVATLGDTDGNATGDEDGEEEEPERDEIDEEECEGDCAAGNVKETGAPEHDRIAAEGAHFPKTEI